MILFCGQRREWLLSFFVVSNFLLDVVNSYSVYGQPAICKEPCKNGGTCIFVTDAENKCQCLNGFKGQWCEIVTSENIPGFYDQLGMCSPRNPCLNGGACKPKELGNGYICQCQGGYTGAHCHLKPSFQDICNVNGQSPCFNGACDTLNGGKSFRCNCKPGYQGVRCDDDIDECASNPCLNKGLCTDKIAHFKCVCNVDFHGDRCQYKYKKVKYTLPQIEASTKRRPQIPQEKLILKSEKSTKPRDQATVGKNNNDVTSSDVCEELNCAAKQGNNRCDPECNRKECGFDAKECGDLWNGCVEADDNIGIRAQCHLTFSDGRCDKACNRKECHFDGFDCSPPRPLCPKQEYCTRVFNNGVCQPECNFPECSYDGGDCVRSDSDDVKGTIIFIFAMNDTNEFIIRQNEFLFDLSRLLRSVIKVQKDGVTRPDDNVKVCLKLDTTECLTKKDSCMTDGNDAVTFIEASMAAQTYKPPFPIKNIKYEAGSKSDETIEETTQVEIKFVLIMGMFGAILVIIFLVVVITQRHMRRDKKIKTRCIWSPAVVKSALLENGVIAETPGTKVGGIDLIAPSNCEEAMLISRGEHGGGSTSSSENSYYRCETLNPLLSSAKLKREPDSPLPPMTTGTMLGRRDMSGYPANCRAGLHCNGPSLLANTLQNTDGLHPIIDPTRLHILDTVLKGITSAGGGCPGDINQPLTNQGETALHLAARLNSGAEVIQRLLDAGADHQCRDEQGYKPLATAAAANAMESAQELLRREKEMLKAMGGSRQQQQHRQASNLESLSTTTPVAPVPEKRARSRAAEMRETTPLIAAVKAGCEYMALMLLNEGMAINAVDENGRNVLHWAAVTNSLEIMRKLFLLRGTMKMIDHKDDMDSTALFLAVREGCLDACELLLDYKASASIPDHTDTLPYQEALKQGHINIYNLLQLRCPDLTIPASEVGSSRSMITALSPPAFSLSVAPHRSHNHSTSGSSSTAASMSDSSPGMKSTPTDILLMGQNLTPAMYPGITEEDMETPTSDFSSVDYFSKAQSEIYA